MDSICRFFFFQAEAGIRDIGVTGVQTCALPISDLILRLIEHEVPRYGLLHLLDLPQERLEIIEIEVRPGSAAAGKTVQALGIPEGSLVISILRDGTGFVPLARSEERRVGKECRSR